MKPSPELQTLLEDLAEDFRPIVNRIEESSPITQNHYGRYMELISSLGKGGENECLLFAAAIIQAGGNKAGVASAMKILFG